MCEVTLEARTSMPRRVTIEDMQATERRMRGQQAALAQVVQVGGAALAARAQRGFYAKFERQVEQAAPGLSRRDPHDFAQRVKAAMSVHMRDLRLLQLQGDIDKAEARLRACPICREERGMRPLRPSDKIEAKACKRHHTAFKRQLLREIAEHADEWTDAIMRDITTGMRPFDPSDLAA